MTFYAIYHRPTDTFCCDGSFNLYMYKRFFTKFCKDTRFYGNPSHPKSYITSALKHCKRNSGVLCATEATEFVIGLEVVEVEIRPQIQKSVYSASFNLDKL